MVKVTNISWPVFGIIKTPDFAWYLHPCEEIRAMEQLQHHMPPNSAYTIIALVNMIECHYYELDMPILIFDRAGNANTQFIKNHGFNV